MLYKKNIAECPVCQPYSKDDSGIVPSLQGINVVKKYDCVELKKAKYFGLSKRLLSNLLLGISVGWYIASKMLLLLNFNYGL